MTVLKHVISGCNDNFGEGTFKAMFSDRNILTKLQLILNKNNSVVNHGRAPDFKNYFGIYWLDIGTKNVLLKIFIGEPYSSLINLLRTVYFFLDELK